MALPLSCALAAFGAVLGASPPAPQLVVDHERVGADLGAPGEDAADADADTDADAGAPDPETSGGGGAADYDAAVAAIDEANIAVNKEPEANLAQLEAAIEELLAFGPQIAASETGREALDLSQLNLARALLLIEDEERAAKVMDAVLLTARDRKLPIKRFGPTLIKFHDKRRKLLDDQGSGSILVNCRVACRVVIDEQTSSPGSGPLYLGTHRVFVEAADGSEPAEHREVTLSEDGVSEVIYYPEQTDDECPTIAPPPPPEPPPPPPKRVLPRWASVTVAVIGVGAVAAGGVLLGLDGKCPGGLDPVADAADCPSLYEGTVSGLVAIGAGSAFLIAGGVTLAVDEVRVGKQKGRQAMLTWKMRF